MKKEFFLEAIPSPNLWPVELRLLAFDASGMLHFWLHAVGTQPMSPTQIFIKQISMRQVSMMWGYSDSESEHYRGAEEEEGLSNVFKVFLSSIN